MKTPKHLLKGLSLQSSRQHRPSMGLAPLPAVAAGSHSSPVAAGAAPALLATRSPGVLPTATLPPARADAPAVDPDELQRIKEQARQEGLANGLKQARAELEKAQREQSDRLRQLMDSLAESAATHRDRIEARLADFAFAAVTRMVGEVALAPETRLACVRSALQACEPWQHATVELNPADAAFVAQALAEGAAGTRLPKVVASPAVRLGGCRVVCGDDVLDARFETQLELLHAALSAARGQ